jgi:hypothetical protein
MGLSVGLHGFDVLAHHAPGNALRAQEVVLWVGHDQRRAPLFDLFDDWIVQGKPLREGVLAPLTAPSTTVSGSPEGTSRKFLSGC